MRLTRKDRNIIVKVGGALSEKAQDELQPMLKKLEGAHVIFDMSDCGPINTVGYHHWTRFLKTLAETSTFELESCNPELIDYCNLLPTLSYADRIASVGVPYGCRDCHKTMRQVSPVEKLDPSKPFKTLVCPHCNGAMRSEVDPEQFLAFRCR